VHEPCQSGERRESNVPKVLCVLEALDIGGDGEGSTPRTEYITKVIHDFRLLWRTLCWSVRLVLVQTKINAVL